MKRPTMDLIEEKAPAGDATDIMITKASLADGSGAHLLIKLQGSDLYHAIPHRMGLEFFKRALDKVADMAWGETPKGPPTPAEITAAVQGALEGTIPEALHGRYQFVMYVLDTEDGNLSVLRSMPLDKSCDFAQDQVAFIRANMEREPTPGGSSSAN